MVPYCRSSCTRLKHHLHTHRQLLCPSWRSSLTQQSWQNMSEGQVSSHASRVSVTDYRNATKVPQKPSTGSPGSCARLLHQLYCRLGSRPPRSRTNGRGTGGRRVGPAACIAANRASSGGRAIALLPVPPVMACSVAAEEAQHTRMGLTPAERPRRASLRRCGEGCRMGFVRL